MKQGYPQTAFKNEEEQQAARILSILIWALWAAYLIVGLIGLYWRDWKLITATLVGIVLQVLPWWLLRRGHLRASSLVVMLSALGIVTIIATVGQGIRDLAIIAFPIVFIFASLTLNRAFFGLCVGLSFAAICWLAFGEAKGWFATAPFAEDPSNWSYLIIVTVILLIAALAADLLATNMRKNLERARHEIALRKQAENALRESENRLQNLFETMAEGVILIAPDGQIVQANLAAEHILGISRPEIESRNYVAPDWAILRPDGTPMPPEEMAGPRAMQEKRPIKDTVMGIRRPDGSVSWINVCAAPLLDSAGELEGVVGTFTDITEHKQAEAVLQMSEENFRNLAESTPDGIVIGAVDGRHVYANRRAADLLRYSPEEMLQTTQQDLADPAEYPKLQQRLQDRIAGRPVPTIYETVIRRKDSTIFPADIAGTRTVWQGQACDLVFIRDITERKQAEEALRESEEKYRTLVEKANEGIIIEQDGVFAFANRRMSDLLGVPAGDLEGKPFIDFVWPEDRELVIANYRKRIAGETVRDAYDFRFIGAGGRSTWVFLSAAVIQWKGKPATLNLLTDITERKRAEEALRELNAVLEQRVAERTQELSQANLDLARAVRLRDEFLANMSHELRTPLNGILGLSESLQEGVYGPLTPKQMHSLQTIESCGQRLLALVSDILDFAKIGAGKLDVRMGPVSVKSVCQAGLRYVEQAAQKKRLTLTSQLDEQVESLQADQRRLKQILVNLLANAAKFTPEGGTVGLEVVGDVERGEARFTVWDTGIGIAPEDIARLFQPFTQLDTGLARSYEGAGLGLALVARLVELHGGRVWVESELGHGSRFIVAIPWQAGGQETRASGHAQAEQE